MDWSKQELKSVIDLYLQVGPSKCGAATTAEVIRLSSNLSRPANSIAFKARNFAFLDPIEETRGAKGSENFSKGDLEAWVEYSGRDLSKRAQEKVVAKGWGGGKRSALKESERPKMSKLRVSLLTKPFTILTGGSGSGKTKLAESLAATLRNADEIEDSTNHAIVPVGADWTDNRQVLGFVNHLRTAPMRPAESADERPVYQTTPVLDLLLEASRPGNDVFPFFLILDEMNLSHVERYFADFLSVMEQRDGVLTLHSEGPQEDGHFRLPRYANDPVGVPRTLPYPQNLFVIGTVNVDETTYMFSPKVLDRANVIEFEVESGQIDDFLKSPHECPEPQKAEAGVAEAFLALAKRARLDPEKGGLDALSGTAADEVREHLVALFKILKRGRFEFAYRTANEVMRYLRVCRYLAAEDSVEALTTWGGGGWRNDLDTQIVQKILPKLHGSMGRVGRLLGALTAYCGGATLDDACHHFPGGKEGTDSSITGLPISSALEPVEGGGHRFNKSRKKLETMIHVLVEEQFVSFIN